MHASKPTVKYSTSLFLAVSLRFPGSYLLDRNRPSTKELRFTIVVQGIFNEKKEKNKNEAS